MAGVVGLREVRYGSGVDAGPTTSTPRATPPTRTSPSTPPSASSARAACGRATRCRAPSPSPSTGAASTRKIAAGADVGFMDSECVSCGACVQACPTATLQEKTVIELGVPTRSVETTCAYCGVGCSFRAELRGDEVVRMVPSKTGGANEGHSCVKGRFAWGYATHPDRVLEPMVRDSIADESGARSPGTRRSPSPPAGCGRSRPSTAGAPSAASPRRAAPTRRSTSSRRWCAPPSATTTSTPAPGSATRRPATASSRPSAPRPARRTSSRSPPPT